MIKIIRIYELYHEFYKIIKSGILSCKIIAKAQSPNASLCAYNGMEYTIKKIIDEIQSTYKTVYEFCFDKYSKSYYIIRNNHISSKFIKITPLLEEEQLIINININ